MLKRRLVLTWALLAAPFFACQCTCVPIVAVDDGGGTSFDGSVIPPWWTDGGSNSDGGSGTGAGINPGQWKPGPGTSDGVKMDPNGNLVLDSSNIRTDFAWIANSSHGWVSKIDTKTGKEVGRYWSVIPRNGQDPTVDNGLRPGGANSPSRTAVDLNGDVFIANRAPSLRGSVTKVSNYAQGCADRNQDSIIRTSTDRNSNGVIDADEMYPPRDASGNPTGNLADPFVYDECVLWTQPLGASSGDVAARAVVIDQGPEGGAGNVWVGHFAEKRFYKVDNTTGKLLTVNGNTNGYVDIPFGPYGAVVDGQGRLWAVEPGTGRLTMINTLTGVADGVIRSTAQFGCLGSYGIGVDGKNRIWLPSWTCAPPSAFRYDPATNTWAQFRVDAARGPNNVSFGRPRGIAADKDGWVWMSADYEGGAGVTHVIAINQETGAFKRFTHPTYGAIDLMDATTDPGDPSWSAQGAIGIGLDSDGNAWVNAGSGRAVGIKRTTGELIKSPNLSSYLYTYSDFTGYALRNFTAPRGWYKALFSACENAKWLSVSWDADVSMCAGNTKCKIQVWVKVAATVAGLGTAQRFGPFETTPTNLQAAGVPAGAVLELETVLLSLDRQTSPVLKSVRVTWDCEPVMQ